MGTTVAPGLRVGRALKRDAHAHQRVSLQVAPGLRVGRGLKQLGERLSAEQSVLRPAFGSGGDWNQNGVTVTFQKPMRPAPTSRARIGTSWQEWTRPSEGKLRPASGPGEDWAQMRPAYPPWRNGRKSIRLGNCRTVASPRLSRRGAVAPLASAPALYRHDERYRVCKMVILSSRRHCSPTRSSYPPRGSSL